MEQAALMVSGAMFYYKGYEWNPLESSADEAEMEAKLRLDVLWGDDCVAVGNAPRRCVELYADHPTPQAARMMAGCRAAEQIAKEM